MYALRFYSSRVDYTSGNSTATTSLGNATLIILPLQIIRIYIQSSQA